MSRRPRRDFTDAFKEQMVQLYRNGKTKAEIIRKYALIPFSLNRWIKQHQPSGSFKEKDNKSPEQLELEKLRKENQQLKMENDILKQAALLMGRK